MKSIFFFKWEYKFHGGMIFLILYALKGIFNNRFINTILNQE